MSGRGWMDHRRLRSGGNSCGAGTGTAPRSSNAARFLVLCLLCALLTGAYAWFTLARSADRSGAGLPGIGAPLDTSPVRPAAGPPAASEESNTSAERLAERAAETTPAGATPGSTPAAVAPETLTSHNDPEAEERLSHAGAPDPTDEPAVFAGSAPEELAAPALRRRFLVRHTGLDRSHGFLAVETDVPGATDARGHAAHVPSRSFRRRSRLVPDGGARVLHDLHRRAVRLGLPPAASHSAQRHPEPHARLSGRPPRRDHGFRLGSLVRGQPLLHRDRHRRHRHGRTGRGEHGGACRSHATDSRSTRSTSTSGA